MSQKKLSAKRKKELEKKQKQQKKIAIMLIVVAVLACAGGGAWVMYDNYQKQQEEKEAKAQKKEQMEISKQETGSTKVNVDAIQNYLGELNNELLSEEVPLDFLETTGEAVSSGAAVQ